MMPTFQEHFLNGAFVSEWMPSSEAAKAVQEHYGCPLDVAYKLPERLPPNCRASPSNEQMK